MEISYGSEMDALSITFRDTPLTTLFYHLIGPRQHVRRNR
jgi:hypothetical protein